MRKETKKGTVLVCVYIDDALCVGDKEGINEFKKEISLHFAIKEEGEMREYVGCKVERRGRDNLIMLNKIKKMFGEKVKDIQEYGMPAGSGEHIKRPDEGEPTLERNDKTT